MYCSTAVLTALALAAPLSGRAQVASCDLTSSDRGWIDQLEHTWSATSRDVLGEEPIPRPMIVYFDGGCVWHHAPGEPIEGRAHGGAIVLPDGRTVPPRLTIFVATSGPDRSPFLVIAMPSMWRAEPRHREDPRLPQLLRAVFAHEMMHVRHASGIGARLDGVEREGGLPDDLDDDIVQHRFAGRPGFREAYERERDLLYRVLENPDSVRGRALVREAAAAMGGRRATYFVGRDALFADLEDTFSKWKASDSSRGTAPRCVPASPRRTPFRFMRRGGRSWSQELGLAVVLAADALLPGWQQQLLASTYVSVPDLLDEAASARRENGSQRAPPGTANPTPDDRQH